jgi:hypothetical protein
MDSLNGTLLQVITEVRLYDGQALTIGGQRYIFRDMWDGSKADNMETIWDGVTPKDLSPARLHLKRYGGQTIGVHFLGKGLSIGPLGIPVPREDPPAVNAATIVNDGDGFVLKCRSFGPGAFAAIRTRSALENGQFFIIGRTRIKIVL